MTQKQTDWYNFIRYRLDELFSILFTYPEYAKSEDFYLYFTYHKKLNDLGFGVDYSTHPKNPIKT